MAGLGMGYQMDEQTLRAEFDRAKAAGHDVMIHYREMDFDLASSMEFMMDCYGDFDRTRSFREGDSSSSAYRDVFRHVMDHGPRRLIAVYDLSGSFEDAVKDTPANHPCLREILPAAAEERAAEEIRARAARPWWQRLFG